MDTSVWVEHFNRGEPSLEQLIKEQRVLCHPLVIGELACGHLPKRDTTLNFLEELPSAVQAAHDDAMQLLERNRLMGRGIGYIDLHLLASTVVTGRIRLWSLDRRLDRIAQELGLA